MSWRKTGTTLQSHTIAKAALPLSAIDLCLLLTGAVMLAVRGRSMHIEFELGGLVFTGTAILALGWIWLFFTRAGVELCNDGITVRNWLRTYEIPWQDVSGSASATT